VGDEIYENTFINAADRSDGQRWLDQWGGNSICYNNTNSGDETRCGIRISERDCTENGGYKDCDPPGMDAVTAYIWNNIYNGSPMDFNVEGNDKVVMLEEKRDYWSDQKQSNAGPTDYFSQGVSANLPKTSSDDDCYWATDTKELYRSIGANNWTFIYTPYTYPHPLQGSPLAITSPNGSEVWHKGETRTISWTANGIVGDLVIELLQNNQLVGVIASDIAASANSFNWIVGKLADDSFVAGQNLKIRIRTVDGQTMAEMEIR